jgi:hypothetical protein
MKSEILEILENFVLGIFGTMVRLKIAFFPRVTQRVELSYIDLYFKHLD